MANIKTKVILVGIGGVSCSGKTTLAKHLKNILPNSVVVHQDDFYLPEEMLPTHQGLNTKNWDSPSSIDWVQMVKVLQDVKCTGSIPSDHVSGHDTEDIPIDDNRAVVWRARFEDLERDCLVAANVKLIWVLVEGFKLYWNQDVIRQLDMRIFLRLPEYILKERREMRDGPLGQATWIDPEGYWDDICYPEYIETHKNLFENGDVEHGAPRDSEDWVTGLLLIEPEVKEKKVDTRDIVEVCLEKIASYSTVAAVSDRMGY
ncbi:hypothetical protein AZE42_06114 [Rhizopogon vesiculosus]|uniref:Phosphoribulokinase/uridine kinase domain-containing protein n=1 Tax=Rhizopogon vesiculosus TaxID=180088 RepID=A0A1J8QP87_9AGAM|nr:hypothetical protein AZE42_06114 [Rhizopogon vesiculosus]